MRIRSLLLTFHYRRRLTCRLHGKHTKQSDFKYTQWYIWKHNCWHINGHTWWHDNGHTCEHTNFEPRGKVYITWNNYDKLKRQEIHGTPQNCSCNSKVSTR
ncbi:uncharacterized protein LOC112451629 [Temnothorax curvispinosus]|uniref:Uncharacterized protein LOC112451629 n=1 Tax=Temnothorax curvispinosus TaxID=300111 RepID=A0A6J1PCE6_9HYME|nr:uncharacterized protein LOC112451629 [Temnothorax curvispinosus]